MNCSHCAAIDTKKRTKKTKLGYSPFFCPQCGSTFNEPTDTPFNYKVSLAQQREVFRQRLGTLKMLAFV